MQSSNLDTFRFDPQIENIFQLVIKNHSRELGLKINYEKKHEN